MTSSCEVTGAFRMRLPLVGELTAESVPALVGQMETARDENGYGASDIGARWPVKDSAGKHVASVTYNGRIIWEAA